MPPKGNTHRVFLSNQAIGRQPVKEKEYRIWDAEQEFLTLRIHPGGSRAWYFYRRQRRTESQPGKVLNLHLGEYPDMLPTAARSAAAKVLAAARNGDSVEFIRERLLGKETTYSDAFNAYLEDHLKVFSKSIGPTRGTIYDAERGFERYFQRFHVTPVSRITTHDVQLWANWVSEKFGCETAKKQFRILKACLNWCTQQGLVVLKVNPCVGVRMSESKARERYLKPGEAFERFRSAMQAAGGDAVDAIWLLLWTGQRRANVFSMEWAEIDWQNQVWTIPAVKTKTGKAYAVALTEAALQILQRRRSSAQDGARWVFPAESASGHIMVIDKVWQRIRAQAGLGDFHLHDLRHSTASMLAMSGASAFTIQQVLCHSSSRTSELYTHLDTSTRRTALEKAQREFVGTQTHPPEPVAIQRNVRHLRLVADA
jgi:integrase